MGYYVSTQHVDIRIDAKNLDAAFKAACELNWRNDLKRGGKSPRPDPLPEGPNEWQWFSWVGWNYHETCKDLVEVLEEFGLEGIETEEDGSVVGFYYDSKTGNEDALFEALAPFIDPDGVVAWRGEGDEYWRWVFRNGKLVTQEGEIVYRED